ncbi:MAG: hypothetical protein M3R57_03850 [Chloroflexota bacterium]|nr:hypothetical protein [Chloroflexota bacterium]
MSDLRVNDWLSTASRATRESDGYPRAVRGSGVLVVADDGDSSLTGTSPDRREAQHPVFGARHRSREASGKFPKALGVVLVAAGVSYVVDVVVAFAAPDLSKQIHGFLAILPAIAEGWAVVSLLVWGVTTLPSQPRVDGAVVGTTAA